MLNNFLVYIHISLIYINTRRVSLIEFFNEIVFDFSAVVEKSGFNFN